MAKIRVILYKTPKKWGFKYLVNHLISIRTWSKYSHIEIWTGDDDPRNISSDKFKSFIPRGNPQFAHSEPPLKQDIAGTCYTSTMRGEDNGTVSRPASEVLDHPKNWDYIPVTIKDELAYDRMISFLEWAVKENKGYSKWDILKFISPFHFPDNDRFICSEIVNDALVIAGILEGKGIVSPQKCVKKLAKVGFTEIINL
jgi:hypothetical protein